MMMQHTHIKVADLTVKYQFHTAVKDVSFSVEKGDFIGIVGENGSGKTTLIKAILGALEPSSGRIEFSPNLKIGYLPQHISRADAVFPASAEEIALMGLLEEKKTPKRFTKKDKEKVHSLFEELGISRLRNQKIGKLSGGEQQRVMLVRALINDPDILILDEPTSALDSIIQQTFLETLKKINTEKKTTILIITHDLATVGQYIDKVLYMNQRLEYMGPLIDFCKSTSHSPYLNLHAKNVCGQDEIGLENVI